jgi:hypothetical protein
MFMRFDVLMSMSVIIMSMSVIMMSAVIVVMMGRRAGGRSGLTFSPQVFFRIRTERRDAMLRAEEILAAVVRNGAGRPGRIDLHATHEVREHCRPIGALTFALQSLGVHCHILAAIPG